MSEIYNIGMRIGLADGVSGVLAAIAGRMFAMEGQVKKLEGAFLGLNRTTLLVAGAMGVAGGVGLASAMMKIASHGDKLLDQIDQLNRLGVTQNEILKPQAGYYDSITKKVPTAPLSEYLKTVKELRAVTGSTEEAAKLAPKALMMDALLGNQAGSAHAGDYYKLLRSSEMKGISTDAVKREAFIEEFYKYMRVRKQALGE